MCRGVQNVPFETANFYEGLKSAKPRPSLADTVGLDPTLYIDDGKKIRMTATEMFRDPVTYAGYLTGGARQCIELFESRAETPIVAVFEPGQGIEPVDTVRITRKTTAIERKQIFNLAAENGPIMLMHKGSPLCVVAALVDAPTPA